MVKGLLFDLDGTLLNTLADLKNAVNYALAKLSLKQITLSMTKQYIGNGIRNLLLRALKEENHHFIDAALLYFKEYYNTHLTDETKPYEKVIDTLRTLKNKGYKIAVVSNKYHEGTKIICEYFFKDLLDFYLGGKDDIPLKPNDNMVNIAIKELSLKKEECIFIGDSDVDILTAKNANLLSVAVTYGYKEIDILKEYEPDYLISSIDEIFIILKEINNE